MSFANKTTDEVAQWWDERPCNVQHSDAPTDTLHYSQQVTWHKYRREPHIPVFAQFSRWRGKIVLEAGCGIGTDTLQFALANASLVFALDISEKSLEIARQRATTHLVRSGIIFLKVDLEQYTHQWGSHQADLIYSFGVLHHTPHPDLALINLLSAAKPTTELRIMLYHRWSTKSIRLGLTNRRIARGSEAREGCPVTYAYSRRSARRLLERTGWHVTSIHVDHIFKWDWRKLKSGEYVVALPWRYIPTIVFRMLERIVGWHLLIVAKPSYTETM